MADTPQTSPTVQIGQIWREDDKRFERYLRIDGFQDERIVMQRVERLADGTWANFQGKKRVTLAKASRFGKSGGYRLEVAPKSAGDQP